VCQQERREKDAGPEKERPLELGGTTHHHEWLELPELIAGKQVAGRTHVRKATGKIIDLPRGLLARTLIADHSERGQQVLARSQLIKIDQPPRRQPLIGFH